MRTIYNLETGLSLRTENDAAPVEDAEIAFVGYLPHPFSQKTIMVVSRHNEKAYPCRIISVGFDYGKQNP